MPPITAKLVVMRKVPSGHPTELESVVTFTADTADESNQAWALNTPAATLNLGLRGDLADQFVVGQPYVLTLESAEDQAVPGDVPPAA